MEIFPAPWQGFVGESKGIPLLLPPFQEGIINHHDHGKANGFPPSATSPQEI